VLINDEQTAEGLQVVVARDLYGLWRRLSLVLVLVRMKRKGGIKE
jgi:hypothetical protein